MRKSTDNLIEANEILSRKYIDAEVCRFSPTYGGRLVMQLESNFQETYDADTKEVLFITIVGCRHISGNFRIENPKLKLTQINNNDEVITILEDEDARFRLIANNAFSITWGFDSDFDDMFENFVSQW